MEIALVHTPCLPGDDDCSEKKLYKKDGGLVKAPGKCCCEPPSSSSETSGGSSSGISESIGSQSSMSESGTSGSFIYCGDACLWISNNGTTWTQVSFCYTGEDPTCDCDEPNFPPTSANQTTTTLCYVH